MAPRRLPFRMAPVFLGVLSVGCFAPDSGRTAPLDRLYFPVGLALNPEATRLYVANSDFDLQFSGGTVQAYDLPALRRLAPQGCSTDADCATDRDGAARGFVCDTSAANGNIPSYFCVDPADPRPCGALGESTFAARLVAPGLCGHAAESSLLAGAVRIGAFVTDVVYRQRHDSSGNPVPDGGGRLFLPVRGDATLHWIDVPSVPPGGKPSRELDCGQDSEDACDANHRRGDDPAEENTTGTRLPPEPYGVAVDAAGEAVVTTHQTTGAASLFVNNWGSGGTLDGPSLKYVLGGLPYGALGVEAVPVSRYVSESNGTIPYEQSFLVTFRAAAQIDLLRYIPDPSAPFLELSGSIPITALSLGWDSRGIAIDDSARLRCENGCDTAADVAACRHSCVQAHGLDVYVANRTPSSVLLGVTEPSDAPAGTNDLPRFYESVAVSPGVTRVVPGNVLGRGGALLPRIFAVCFDSRRIYVYDPAQHRVETVIQTGNGPQAIAVDGAHGLGYVAHFSESYLGVVDLDQSHVNTYGQMVLTVGEPTPPRASK